MTATPERLQDWFRPHFERFEASLNGGAEAPVHAIRRRAFERFLDLGFPGTSHEEWRFTNVAPIARGRFAPRWVRPDIAVTVSDLHRFTFGGLRCTRLVFLDGVYSPALSSPSFLPAGVTVGSLVEAIHRRPDLSAGHLTKMADFEHEPFTALNTAFLRDGAFVEVPDGAALTDPLHLLFVATAQGERTAVQPRNLIIAGAGSRLSVVESYVHLGSGAYFTNAVTEIAAGPGADIEHDRLLQEAEEAFHVGAVHVRQQAGSRYTANAITLGGSIVRNTVTAVLAGEGAHCTLNGLSLAARDQLIDNHTAIDHAQPRCTSHELYKAILDGRSRGVFNGKIFVRKDAQKTDARQTNKTLLLSDEATIDTKPQLEIFADDVKCTHGATVGALDEEQIFYLRSRGMGRVEARDVLTYAFAADVIDRVHVDPLRRQLEYLLHQRLRQGRVAREDDETGG